MTAEVRLRPSPAARLTIMKRIGHFPMIENYPEFRPYLLDALKHVAG